MTGEGRGGTRDDRKERGDESRGEGRTGRREERGGRREEGEEMLMQTPGQPSVTLAMSSASLKL